MSPRFYRQPTEPLDARDGDYWLQTPTTKPKLRCRLFGHRWMMLVSRDDYECRCTRCGRVEYPS